MSCDIKIKSDGVEVEFNRTITASFAKWLRDENNTVIRLGFPEVGMLIGRIEATVVPDPTGRPYLSAMYSYHFPADYQEHFKSIPNDETIVANNVLRGELIAYASPKVDINKPTAFEVFTEPTTYPTNKASSSWDHKDTIEEVLFSRETVFVNGDFKAHWSDAVADGLSILIPHTANESGSTTYTELTLAEGGWHYASDLATYDTFEELPTKEAMGLVQAVTTIRSHQP